MCGIAGFHGKGDAIQLRRMTQAIAHRGPDGEGHYADDTRRLYLGHRRLSVLDIEGGAQPMWNADDSVGIVFNGEIYNHHELRRQLQQLGHVFRSDHSDTEVLIHGYRQWGRDLPERLNGMFAFALYDRQAGKLFLARDRMGKKPLFYVDQPGLFAFASEITALLAHGGVPRQRDSLALRKFFAHCFFPAPHTPYTAIRKLPGGHWLEYDLSAGTSRQGQYWRFRLEPRDDVRSDGDLADELRHLLAQAVQRRMEADVPLGVLLSGGVDSSAILAFAAQSRGAAGIDAFSMGFVEQSYDETPFARQMADHVGARLHSMTCDLETAKNEIGPLLGRLDEPLADSSILPTWLVCRHARQKVTVALTGDGADELFAGYDTFKALSASHLYRRMVPAPLHAVHRHGARLLLPPSDRNMSLDFKVGRWLRGVGFPPALWNPVWIAALEPAEIDQLFGAKGDLDELYSEVIALWNSCDGDLVDRSLEFFTGLYLQDDILVKSDRASMLESLELRSPFLDPDVVDFARKLPNRHKFAKGERKVILRKALRGIVPDSLLDRRKKGFGIPLAGWLRTMTPPKPGSLPELDEAWLTKRWGQHAARKSDCRHGLWCWLALHHHVNSV